MLVLRFLLSLRLKHAFEKFRQRRFIFRAARVELQCETDLFSVVDNFGPEVNRLRVGEFDFETVPPVSTKHPLRLRSVTVASSRDITPSQRAESLTRARGADLLSFSIAGPLKSVGERTTAAVVLRVEMSACFPEFGKEFLVERRFQVADSFRSACAPLSADHALDHLYVMVTPEREIFVMFEQRFRKLKLFVFLFEVSNNFEYC